MVSAVLRAKRSSGRVLTFVADDGGSVAALWPLSQAGDDRRVLQTRPLGETVLTFRCRPVGPLEDGSAMNPSLDEPISEPREAISVGADAANVERVLGMVEMMWFA